MLPLFTQPYVVRFANRFLNQENSVEKNSLITNGLAVAFKKFYSIRLRGTKVELEWASIGHL